MATAISSPKTKSQQSDIDLTSMLDVVFILLIFFVVTATFLKEAALPVTSQERSRPEIITESDGIVLQLTADNRVSFNGEWIDVGAVRARIASARAENPGVGVVISPASDSKAEPLVMLINAARQAGVNDIAVVD